MWTIHATIVEIIGNWITLVTWNWLTEDELEFEHQHNEISEDEIKLGHYNDDDDDDHDGWMGFKPILTNISNRF